MNKKTKRLIIVCILALIGFFVIKKCQPIIERMDDDYWLEKHKERI